MYSVKDTNIEALKAKKSAIAKGYMKDGFINFFVPQKVKKEILMNRGYWLRYYCFRQVVNKFMNNVDGPCQIVSLGCGLDTLPFNLLYEYKDKDFLYLECDLPSVVT